MTTTNQKPWIKCPSCGYPTVLNTYPSDYAGIWECTNDDCGASDACEHASTHVESLTIDTMRNGEYDQREVPGYVCDDCETVVEGDPVADSQPDYEPDDQ